MTEQFRRILPLIRLELPLLPRREHSDDAGPVIRLELVGRVDKDEAQGSLGIYAGEEAGDLEEVGAGAGVGVGVDAVAEEGLDVAHAEEG